MSSTTKTPPSAATPTTAADGQAAIHFSPAFQAAMRELVKAYELAVQSHLDPWDLAIEIRELKAIGMTVTDLRWLVRSGYVEHAREVTELEDDGRQFRRTGNLSFAKRTCFVLTASGHLFALALLKDGVLARSRPPNSSEQSAAPAVGMILDVSSANTNAPPTGTPECADHPEGGGENRNTKPLLPVWDRVRHELRVEGQLVKRFKCAAVNQETILAAFDEEGWPPRIDDPLPPQEEQDSKRRLNDTIKCLNKNQKHKRICFHGDGTGEGVLWSVAECDKTESTCPREDCPVHAQAATACDITSPSPEASPPCP